jgi:hypothetical protein
VDALQDTEVLFAVILFDNVETPGVWVVWVHVHDEVVQIFQLFVGSVVVGEEFSHVLGLGFLEGDFVWVPADDVLEKGLELVDVVVLLSAELELLDFLVLHGVPLLLFDFPDSLLSQILDDSVIVATVLLPELIKLFILGQGDFQIDLTHLETFLFEFFDDLLGAGFVFDCEISLVFIESDVGSEHSEVLQKALFDKLE